LQVSKGNALLIKKDIFKNLMWYILPDSNKQYPVTIDRVKKIKSQNQQGIVPDELGAVEVTSSKPKEVEPEYVDLVGQISLQTLEKAERKRRQQTNQKPQRDQRSQRQQPQPRGGQMNKGQQQNPQQNSPQPPRRNPNQQKPRPPFNRRDK